jgi:hypothetical protein
VLSSRLLEKTRKLHTSAVGSLLGIRNRRTNVGNAAFMLGGCLTQTNEGVAYALNPNSTWYAQHKAIIEGSRRSV